ncbi:EamA family transporter [Affinibrenneria salicis]|uniref:EamA family transporter n=1 Tax=Affinibrenneria salicis TaxID=2590031 RepID=A0A5J5FZB6_9GAMM|nr:EamA family transporter [Affinibrenneria salicis]KAA8998507.1 EamA family transporter [Affinibrenneria salicis]
MSAKDRLLALCVVLVWGINFVVIKVGLHDMPPFLLAGLRFTLVALPAIFFFPRPAIPLRWLLAYGMTMSFGQFGFLFCAIKLGMPAGLASLVIQCQVFFTLLIGAGLLAEKLRWHHIAGMLIATLGMLLLAEGGMAGATAAGMSPLAFMLTLGAALCWAFGNISNKVILAGNGNGGVMSLVVWGALVPILPFLLCSWLFEGRQAIVASLIHIRFATVCALLYLAFLATILGYAIWGDLLARYETWRVAPLALLVPVVGLISAALLLGERLSALQIAGALFIMSGLLVNLFAGRLLARLPARQH